MTVEPNPACQGWPPAMGTRRYLAEITQHSSRLLIDFSGATFEGSTRFNELAYEDRVTLDLIASCKEMHRVSLKRIR